MKPTMRAKAYRIVSDYVIEHLDKDLNRVLVFQVYIV